LSFVEPIFFDADDGGGISNSSKSGKSPKLLLRRPDNDARELFVFCMNKSSMGISESAISPSLFAKRD
jgi:hypothetical protein